VTRSLRGNGERILLVEDEKTILNFMKKRLLDEGYVVFTAENVSDASKIYESEKSAFDLLFTDIVLPDRSGVELIDKLYSKNPRLKVLLTSGYLYNESEWPSLKDVNLKFIQKPYTVNGLLLAIRSSIDEARGG
jgi:DNA-binding NtrC family response regulator